MTRSEKPLTGSERTSIEPLDPDSELGQRVATGLADVLDDVAERQAREAAAAAIETERRDD